MRRAAIVVLYLALAATAMLAPGAAAQTEQQQQPVLSINQITVPGFRGKLLSNGVLVNASCTPACLLLVQLEVSPGTAKRVRLGNPIVGSATASAPDNTPVLIRARINRKARKALAGLRGTGDLRIRVTALP